MHDVTQVSADELRDALPHVMAAPKTDAAIAMLCFRADFGARAFPDRLSLTRAGGIPGERWLKHAWSKRSDGSPDPRIQVSLLPLRVLDLVWRDRVGTPHPGDTIVADLDMSEANLPPGSLLQAGTAVLRVSDLPNNGCAKWKVRYGAAALEWVATSAPSGLRLRGVLCAVEMDGVVCLSDRIHKL